MFENRLAQKVEAYEASAGVVICLLMAGLFALGAAAIGLAGHIGPVFSSLFFSGVFTILALGFWMFSSAKHGEASHELEVAERKVSQTADVAAAAVKSAATAPSVWLPALALMGLLYLVHEGRRPKAGSLYEDD